MRVAYASRGLSLTGLKQPPAFATISRPLHFTPKASQQQPLPPPPPLLIDNQQAVSSPRQIHASLVDARKSGSLGFGFSAGGLLFPYYIGVVSALEELGVLGPDVPLAGASAGSLIAACFQSGLTADEVLSACLLLAHDCRTKGTRFRLNSVLEGVMQEVLPPDAHERCSGNTYIAVTQVYPKFEKQLVANFHTREDLIQTLLTSCHIPWYFNGTLVREYRGAYCFDGGITQFIPVPPVQNPVQVCCFPSQQMRVFTGIQIAPDKFGPWPHDMSQMLAWAFEPGSEEFIKTFVTKGKEDATIWATEAGLGGSVGGEVIIGGEANKA